MPHVVCGRCGRRTMIVTDEASAPCPRCGETLALRPENRVIRVRHQIPILNWLINGAILSAAAFGIYWAYGWVVATLNKPPDTSFGVKRYPGSDSNVRAPIPDTAPAPPPPITASPPPPPPPAAEIDLASLRAESPVPVKVVRDAEFFERLERATGTTDADLAPLRRLIRALGGAEEADFADRARRAIRAWTPAFYDAADKTVVVRDAFDPTIGMRRSPEMRAFVRELMLLRAAAHARIEGRDAPEDADLALALRCARESAATKRIVEIAARGRPGEFAQQIVQENQLGRHPDITVAAAAALAETQRAELDAQSVPGAAGFVVSRHLAPRARLVASGTPLSMAEVLHGAPRRVTMRFRTPEKLLPDWKLVDENTFGVHGLAEMARLGVTRFASLDAGAWAGDRWALFEKDGKHAFVLAVASRGPVWRAWFSGPSDDPSGVAYGRMSITVLGVPDEQVSTVAARALRLASLVEAETAEAAIAFLRRADVPDDAAVADRWVRESSGGADLAASLLYACTAHPSKALAWLEAHVKDEYALGNLPAEPLRLLGQVLREVEPQASPKLKAIIRKTLARIR